jgi:hypothetical protein
MAFDPSGGTTGLLYFAERTAVRSFDPASGQVTTVAGMLGVTGTMNGIGTAAQFTYATAVALDGAGNLLITDRTVSLVRSLALATGEVTTFLGTGQTFQAADGLLADASIVAPTGIYVHPAGAAPGGPEYVLITDDYQGVLREAALYSPTQQFVSTRVGVLPPAYYGSQFGLPASLTTDDSGTLWAADVIHGDIASLPYDSFTPLVPAGAGALAISRDGATMYITQHDAVLSAPVTSKGGTPQVGTFTVLAGGAPSGCDSNADGVGSAAGFCFPTALALDDAGHLYVGEGQDLRRIELATATVTTVAGNRTTYDSRDGVGAGAGFAGIVSLAYVSSVGQVYAGDDDALRAIDPATGAVTTPVGKLGALDLVDGVGTSARFVGAQALAYDRSNDVLYVGDGSSVRRVDPRSGTVSTFLGNGYAGVATGALPGQLNGAFSLAVRADGLIISSGAADQGLVYETAEQAYLIAHASKM